MAHEGERDTELQLLRVSKGAHRLTEMIDSLSKAPNLDGQAHDVARELLRGAVDLQESLVMLGKLQDVSKQMVKSKKKNVAAFDGEREARHSVDGSSRDCIEELRRVIRDSFQRHNLLTQSSQDERALSSRSMRFNLETELKEKHHEERRDEFAANKKVKAPNLIAKLMGLEEVPSEEKYLSLKPLRTPTFDIHMPKVRKQQAMEKSPDLQKKTLQDIIEQMQFKGILKSGQAEDLRIGPLAPNSSPLHRYRSRLHYDDEAPPIVIMKPLKSPGQERIEAQKDFHLQIDRVLEETETVTKGAAKIMEKPKVDIANKVKAKNSQNEQTKEELKTSKKIVDGQKPLLTTRKSEEKEVKKDSKKNKEDGKVIKPSCETDATASSTLPAHGETKEADVNKKPCSKDEQKTLGKALPKNISGERSSTLAQEAIQISENKPTVRDDLKCILLSNQSFLKDAQKFISPNGQQPIYRRKSIEAAGRRDAKLFLDCAIELMARKKQQKELASLPIFRAYIQAPTLYLSLDPLLLEISKGFEKLTTNFHAVDADATYEDTLYVKLEKDLKCKDMMINSMWDVGWSHCCVCIEEAEQVAGRVGEDILFWLIEELAMEILLFSYYS
ncbi:hypothetical protein J5N97_007614 [Dioscorea zingiberensis]|uniref:DUF3741 domain-containing protein n=1 Tax=Dioscorea zingiberensis TaxID=325984 RepID=A0A9D5DDS9_9LILI|nr:hypothetical protein J5N97_007614 [Dioscorea zingiberensis]